jgi:hypothetical protein
LTLSFIEIEMIVAAAFFFARLQDCLVLGIFMGEIIKQTGNLWGLLWDFCGLLWDFCGTFVGFYARLIGLSPSSTYSNSVSLA